MAFTGIIGLDEFLTGGLTSKRMCLLEGTPGSGKTTLGLSLRVRLQVRLAYTLRWLKLAQAIENSVPIGGYAHRSLLDNYEMGW